MRKSVLLLVVVSSACSPGSPGTGENVDLGVTGTTFDSGGPSPSLTSSTSTGEVPDIPTTGGGGTGGGETGAGSTGDAPVCGDGVIQNPEMCDDGFDANKATNPCTMSCKLAVCGDGHVQPSNKETCDDGALNQPTPGYNECSSVTCTREAYCGDGVIQAEAGEECEAAGDEENNCAGMCRHKPRLLFITSTTHTGNLGGLAGADKHCNQLAAQQPGLTGTYRAWLLVNGQSLQARFPEFVAPVAWNFTNTSAGLLAKSFAELVEKGPSEPVAFTEAGDAVQEVAVWTGITKDGLAADGDCGQWTSEAGSAALVGHSGYVPNVGPDALLWRLERKWTDRGFKVECTELSRFYCVQVAD